MSLVQPSTLAEYVGEETVTAEMAAAIERAEAIAASRIGCRELRSRTVTETISIANEYRENLTALSTSTSLRYPMVHLSDGPARSLNSMTFTIGDNSQSVLSTATITDTGWAVRYRHPFGFGFTIDLPYDEAFIQVSYEAGWETESDLPAGIRQFVIAQATQVYATPIGGVIKVRLGDNYVDLNPAAIAKQVDQYAEMLDQWVRVRL
jgi:hypothetical protein